MIAFVVKRNLNRSMEFPDRYPDPRRVAWPLAVLVPLLPIVSVALAHVSGFDGFYWLTPVLVFGMIPLLDRAFGLDRFNPDERFYERLDNDRYYRWCTFAYLPVQYLALVVACREWAGGNLGVLASLGLAISTGIVAGVAINTAHELGHKHPTVERWAAKVALAQSGYGHFVTEHNRGHHTRVATPEDPASSRLGENFYEFWPRTVIGGVRSAVGLERERAARLGRSFWSPRNDVLNAWVLSIVLAAALLAAFGWSVAPWLVLQAVVGFSLLEVVNYLEHYGLARQKRPSGRYERCRPEHSWNASNLASNLLLFQLQRHSDHHANPLRRYQTLRHFDDVPQLPTGYAGMILVAIVPPLWRRMMDDRVVAFYDGDATRANIHPRVRERMLARYEVAEPVAS